RTVRGVLRRAAHRELVEVRLAEDDRVRGAEARNDRRLVRRAVVREDLRAARRRHPARDDVVLERDRQAGERTAALLRVDASRVGERAFLVDAEERVHPRVDGADAVELRADGLFDAHSMIFGTTKKGPLRSGALASACSVVRLGRGTSSRITLA